MLVLSGTLPTNWAQMSLMLINLSRNAMTGELAQDGSNTHCMTQPMLLPLGHI